MIAWPAQPTMKKYEKWYEALITDASNRALPAGEYTESHHIIPKSFGGSNDKSNLVRLTAREHYVAHLLLWKMRFPGNYGSKMSFAFGTFINKFKVTQHDYKITSRIYESFKKDYSLLMQERMKGEGNHFYGKTHSTETRKIIGEKSKLKIFKSGPENPNWGKKLNISPEGLKARKDAVNALWADPVWKENTLKKFAEVRNRPDVVAKRKANAEKFRGVKRDPAIIEKTASKKRGKKEHEIYSPEAILRRKEALKNRVLSDAGRERIRESIRKIGQRPKTEEWKKKMSERMKGIKRETFICEHCGIETVLGNIRRWHGDNCKHKSVQ